MEFLSGTTWTAVCDSDWDDKDAKVACRFGKHCPDVLDDNDTMNTSNKHSLDIHDKVF